jgi:hypothetical protein
VVAELRWTMAGVLCVRVGRGERERSMWRTVIQCRSGLARTSLAGGARGIFPRQNRDTVSLLRFSSGEAENRGIGRKKMTLGVHSSASAREKR